MTAVISAGVMRMSKNSFLSHSESDSHRIYSYTAANAEMISSERQNCMEPVSDNSFAWQESASPSSGRHNRTALLSPCDAEPHSTPVPVWSSILLTPNSKTSTFGWFCYVPTCFRLISPIIFKKAFIQRGKSMGEMLSIPPKSLLNHSRHPSHTTQTTLIGTTS